jgi:type II secretory pathway pseudopilin PulG
MGFSRKKGFTLWEILVIIVVISVGLMAIISLLTYGLNYVQKSRQRIIAINLAREGIESIYQIRDTNRLRRAGRKEQCRLKTHPLLDNNNDGCSNDSWIQSGSYILDAHELSGQNYLSLSWAAMWLNVGNGIDTWDLAYSLCLSGGLRIACPGTVSVTTEGRYFREIRWYGLFSKDTTITGWQYINCTSGVDYLVCWSSSAKEFRFCSKVIYLWYGTGEVELCGLMTNFIGK